MSAKHAVLLVAVVAVLVSIYVIAVRQFQRDAALQRHTFGVGVPAADRLDVSAQIISVNPVRDSVRVRFGFKPLGKYGVRRFGRFANDMTVIVSATDGYHSIHVAAGETAVAINKDIDLSDGSPNDYPFDRYTARIAISALAHPGGDARSLPVPVVVHYEEQLGNYAITATLGVPSTPTSADVELQIRRSAAIVTFSSMMYAAMILVSTSVVILTLLVVIGRIEPEFSTMLWSGAMLFALPAVRNSLPDSPPLSIQCDFYIFMWAEFAVALSMVTLTSYFMAHRARGTPSSTA